MGPIPLNDKWVRGLKSCLYFLLGKHETRYVAFKSWLVLSAAELGLYESSIVTELAAMDFEDDSVAVDVGANCGVYTKLFLRLLGPKSTVHAFEPNPVYMKTLRSLGGRESENSRLNIYAMGVSDQKGQAYLNTPTVGAGVPEPALAFVVDYPVPNTQAIEITTLDSTLSHLHRLDLLKIDVEGGECAVLRGAAGLIRRFKPVLVIEAHDRMAISKTLSDLEVDYRGGPGVPQKSLDQMPVSVHGTYVLRAGRSER